MSAFSRNLCSTASRSLRSRASVVTRATRPIALRAFPSLPVTSRAIAASSFSTMTTLKSEVKQSLAKREYDPEIKDMASYIHNTPIDSELAVSSYEYRCRE